MVDTVVPPTAFFVIVYVHDFCSHCILYGTLHAVAVAYHGQSQNNQERLCVSGRRAHINRPMRTFETYLPDPARKSIKLLSATLMRLLSLFFKVFGSECAATATCESSSRADGECVLSHCVFTQRAKFSQFSIKSHAPPNNLDLGSILDHSPSPFLRHSQTLLSTVVGSFAWNSRYSEKVSIVSHLSSTKDKGAKAKSSVCQQSRRRRRSRSGLISPVDATAEPTTAAPPLLGGL